MALNKLKKWIGTQAMTAFFDQLNDNVDATNAAIDLAEQNSATIASHLADNAAHGLGNKADKAWVSSMSLTLQNGWTGALVISKHDTDIVRIVASHITASGTIADGTVIATIPPEYRITGETVIPTYNRSRGKVHLTLVINPNGDLMIRDNTDIISGNNLSFRVIY